MSSGTVQGHRWLMVQPGAPMQRADLVLPPPGSPDGPPAGHVRVAVEGCGICHTDIGFWREGVRTRKPPPIALGHEVVGTALDGRLEGRLVVVPAVMPCGECRACTAGHPGTCTSQVMPGNDSDGGFATHLVVPGRFLQPVPEGGVIEPWQYAAAADAASTAWNAVAAARIPEGGTAVVIGAGGVGGFAAQAARIRGARVLALDVDAERLEALERHGGVQGVCTLDMSPREVRSAVTERLGRDRFGWRIVECSGTAAGQETAFALLGPAGRLGVIGFTPRKVAVRLSNLMAFEAEAYGVWGCPPAAYPEVIRAMASGELVVAPFLRPFPMDQVNQVLDQLASHRLRRRPVLLPARAPKEPA